MAHAFLGFVGAGLIIVALFVIPDKKTTVCDSLGNEYVIYEKTDFYDAFMGIWCSLIATAAGTLILMRLLREMTEVDEELKQWGILKIYSKRTDILDEGLPDEHFVYSIVDINGFNMVLFNLGTIKHSH